LLFYGLLFAIEPALPDFIYSASRAIPIKVFGKRVAVPEVLFLDVFLELALHELGSE
jgi:hypothetical protein